MFDSKETLNLLSIPIEVAVYKSVRSVVPEVKGVKMITFETVAISISQRLDGESKAALLAALSLYPIKQAIVVDADVNINDMADIFWAVATRLKEDGVIKVYNMPGFYIDPSNKGGKAFKLGIDATKPRKEAHRFERIRIPLEDKVNLDEYLK